MSAAKKKARPEPFAHAADLPAAYRELAAAMKALESFPPPIDALGLTVADLSPHSLWSKADAAAAAWERVAAAARRVEVAKSGPRSARRWVGFKRAAQKARKAA